MPQTVWILGFASLFTDISSEMIHSVLPLFIVATLHSSASMVGLIDGVGEALASILKLFSGALSDYFGKRKPLLLAGYGLSTIVKPLFAIAPDPTTVLIARCLDRTGKGIRGAPRDAMVADVTDPSIRGAAYGLRQSLDSIGAFVGPLIALIVLTYANNDYRLVFWVALVPGIVTIFLLSFGIKEPARHIEGTSKKELPNWQSIKTLGTGFWFVFAVVMIFTFGNSSDAFILLRARQLGVPTNLVPLVLVVMNVVYAATAYPAGRLSDRIGKKAVVLMSFALYAVVYAGLALCSSVWQIWVLVGFYGLYMGLGQGALLAITADRVPADRRGTAFGLLNLSMGLGVLPASLLAGWLWDSVSPQATFLAGAAFSMIALFLFSLDSIGKEVGQP